MNKVAPINTSSNQGMEEHHIKRVSFQQINTSAIVKPVEESSSRTSPPDTKQNMTPAASSTTAETEVKQEVSHNENHRLARPHIMSKVSSCPTNVSVSIGRSNPTHSLHQEETKTRSGRRRVQSMPSGSRASHDFFGTGSEKVPVERMEKIHEDFRQRDGGKDATNKLVVVEEKNSETKQKVEQTKVDTAVTVPQQTSLPVAKTARPNEQDVVPGCKCQCIIL